MYDWNFDGSWNNTWLLLRQAREAMYRTMEVSLQRQSVTIEQLEVLYFLSQYPDGATVDELSIWGFRQKISVLHLVERMENKGLVNRRKKSDQKRVYFHITNKGEQQLIQHVPITTSVVKQLEQQFSEEERQQLNGWLKRIRDIYLKQLALHAISPRNVKAYD